MRFWFFLPLVFAGALLSPAVAQQPQPVDPAPSETPRPARAGNPEKQAEVEDALRRVTDVYSAIEENAADPIGPEDAFYKGAIPGMLRHLDPYSVFFDAEQFKTLQEHQQEKSEGFGTIVSVMPGRVLVLESFVGSPAARAGIQPGDEILGVNNIRLEPLTVDQIVQVLGEARQQKSEIYILHPNSSRVERVVATPAEMAEASVDGAFFLDKGIGYLHVQSFESKTAEGIRDALQKWGGDIQKLVIDLRDNRGGLVVAAADSASLFLPQGAPILTARARDSVQKKLDVEKSDPLGQKLKIAILVSGKTASAAEILAGALQDNHRAILVGERTFGKGTVQSVYPLSNGTGLALAVARYVTPSGHYIERTRTEHGGIEPNVVVPPRAYNEIEAFLEQHSLFLEFARKLRTEGRTFNENFEVTPQLLDEFRAFLNDLRMPVAQNIWSNETDYIRQRLRVDITNMMFGVARGDQVAAGYDPQVQRAVALLKQD